MKRTETARKHWEWFNAGSPDEIDDRLSDNRKPDVFGFGIIHGVNFALITKWTWYQSVIDFHLGVKFYFKTSPDGFERLLMHFDRIDEIERGDPSYNLESVQALLDAPGSGIHVIPLEDDLTDRDYVRKHYGVYDATAYLAGQSLAAQVEQG